MKAALAAVAVAGIVGCHDDQRGRIDKLEHDRKAARADSAKQAAR